MASTGGDNNGRKRSTVTFAEPARLATTQGSAETTPAIEEVITVAEIAKEAVHLVSSEGEKKVAKTEKQAKEEAHRAVEKLRDVLKEKRSLYGGDLSSQEEIEKSLIKLIKLFKSDGGSSALTKKAAILSLERMTLLANMDKAVSQATINATEDYEEAMSLIGTRVSQSLIKDAFVEEKQILAQADKLVNPKEKESSDMETEELNEGKRKKVVK